jgi:hypothetical protein
MKKDMNIYVRKETITADCLHLFAAGIPMFKSFKLRLYTGSSFLGVRVAAAVTTPKFLKLLVPMLPQVRLLWQALHLQGLEHRPKCFESRNAV